jgi:hypothetical protein
VWIDNETGMPLKRTWATSNGEQIRITESYGEFNLNPNFDTKVFELPKHVP